MYEPATSDLSVKIQAKIAAGQLSTRRPVRTWTGYGNGRRCDGCDLPINTKHVEDDAELPDGRTLRFHEPCFAIWVEGRRRLS